MGMGVNVGAEVTQARIDAMVAAGNGTGATPSEVSSVPHVDDLNLGDGPPADEPEDDGQRAQLDPIAKVKADYEAKLAALQEDLDNQKAMQSESHKRNAGAKQDRLAAEEAARQSIDASRRNEALARRIEGMGAGLAQMAKLNPEQAGMILQTWAQDNPGGSTDQQFAIGSPQREDPRISQLQERLDKFEKNVSGFAFELNAGAVTAAIDRMTSTPAFELPESLGEMDEVRERVWLKFIQQDKENPGAVNPHNQRQISEAVKKLVEVEATRWKKINDKTIKGWREKRKALNAQAGAPSRGPSANVRAAPAPTACSSACSSHSRPARLRKSESEV